MAVRQTMMPDAPLLLIVRQRPAPHPQLDRLLEELRASGGLDPYVVRQRLLGQGLAQLASGAHQLLDRPAAVLGRYGYHCWVTAPPRPDFAPVRLRRLAIGSTAVDFHCDGERRLRLERGGAAVGVLADLSGELAGRQAKRLLAQYAYLGREQATAFTPMELRAAILKAQPVFDCYLLDAQGAVTSALRVFPGRFDPAGLGPRARPAAAGNLAAVIDLVGEYAGSFRLYADFGLSPLPGCLPQPAANDPATLADNLAALTRYGGLVAGLAEPPATGRHDQEGIPGTEPATGLAESIAAAGRTATGGEPAPARAAPLPPPPERSARRVALRQAIPAMAAVAGGVLLAAAGPAEPLRELFRHFVRSGALPALASVGLCWGAFACLRLKRRIEDTPTSRIRSLAMGLVEVQGRAVRRYALVAPMSQGACVWYRLRKYRRDRSDQWQLASETDSAHVPFMLEDGSGRILIEPAGATVKARARQTGYPGASTLIGAAVEGGPDEKWVEELICEGTSLYVLGYARPARSLGTGPLRERTIELLRRLKLDPHALRRYDANRDGRLDAREWQAARDDAERQAAADQLAGPSGPPIDPVLLGRPPRGLPFLIAEEKTGTALAGRYGWFAAVLLALGVTLCGLALKLALDFVPRYWR